MTNTVTTPAANVVASVHTVSKEMNAMNTNTSSLASKQAFVAGFAKGQIVTASVVGSNNAGLTVNLADNSPMTALCLGLSQSERDTVMASVTAGTLVSFAVEVVEADPRSTDAKGNIRARLVVRLSHSEANKLASDAIASFKPGDTFTGLPVKLVENDNGVAIGIVLKDARARGFLHANQVDGGRATLTSIMVAGVAVKTTVLNVDADNGRMALTTKPASFVINLLRLSTLVGQTVTANIMSDRVFKGRVKANVMGVPAEVDLSDVKLADGQSKIKVAVNAVNTQFGTADVSIVAANSDGRSRIKNESHKSARRSADQELRNGMKGSSSGGKNNKGGK